MIGRKSLKSVVLETRQSSRSPDPDVSACVFYHWSNAVVGQTFVDRKTSELSIVPAHKPVRCTDPQSTLSILTEETDVVAFERGRVFFIEDGEVQAVKTNQTFLRSDPEI